MVRRRPGRSGLRRHSRPLGCLTTAAAAAHLPPSPSSSPSLASGQGSHADGCRPVGLPLVSSDGQALRGSTLVVGEALPRSGGRKRGFSQPGNLRSGMLDVRCGKPRPPEPTCSRDPGPRHRLLGTLAYPREPGDGWRVRGLAGLSLLPAVSGAVSPSPCSRGVRHPMALGLDRSHPLPARSPSRPPICGCRSALLSSPSPRARRSH